MRKFFLLALCGLMLIAPRSRGQFSSLIVSVVEVNLDKKDFSFVNLKILFK